MENEDFKAKRIDYINMWPNTEPFDIEKKYYSLVEKLKEQYKDEPEMTFEDSYYNEVGLPLMLCKR